VSKLIAVVVLLAGLAGSACASLDAKARLGREKGPDLAVVESLVREGKQDRAEEYLRLLGLAEADVIAAMQRAKDRVAKEGK